MGLTEIRNYYETFGQVRYFHADRCFNTDNIKRFNKGRIKAEELVTYDCGLMEIYEFETENEQPKDEQVLAMLVRPGTEPEDLLDRKGFIFCGYDLVDVMTAVSVITNCGAMFDKVIKYDELNSYGLISTYKEAVYTQLGLQEQYEEESHAYCEIVEIWRKLVKEGAENAQNRYRNN